MAVADATPAVRRRLAGLTFRPVWLALAVVAAVHLLGATVPVTARYGLLLATLVALGLPHGAVDHLTVPRARGEWPTLRWLAGFCVAYLTVAAAYTVGWFLAPMACFLGFIALTWFHWGQGDRAHLAVIADAPHLKSRWRSRATILVRGGLPMLVPLLAFPDRYREVLLTAVSLFGRSGEWVGPLFATGTRLTLGAGFALATVGTLAAGYRAAGDTDAWRVDAGETALLWAYFLTVPPVLAIGLYFALWHSLRHLVRLLALDDQAVTAVDRGADLRAAWRLVRDATPLTVASLLIFGGLALLVPDPPGTIAGLGGLYLVLLAVLTLPHVLVVSYLDRLQGVVG
jgi:Brp/Blh family beta-carotene 15,15'-monooxygenase